MINLRHLTAEQKRKISLLEAELRRFIYRHPQYTISDLPNMLRGVVKGLNAEELARQRASARQAAKRLR